MVRRNSKAGHVAGKRRAARGGARRDGRHGERATLYDEVTAGIIAQMERGTVPWVKPWNAAQAATGLPRNAVSKRPYSGINILLLWGAVIEGSFPSQDWLTFRQAQAAGGCVRKGERGRTVFYADRFIPKRGHGQAGEDDEPRAIHFLKKFTVFNAAQCDGLPDALVAQPAPLPPRELHAGAEALIAASGAELRIGGARAFYSPAADFVALPPQPAFPCQLDYYRTALHELGHWTGHGTRLDRDQTGRFGTQDYAREELIAELAAAFSCAALGIEPSLRHADYLASWLAVLRADSRAIFRAASAAAKASDFLLHCGTAMGEQAA